MRPLVSIIILENAKGRVIANKILGCKAHSYTVEFAAGGNAVVKLKKYAVDAIS